MASDPPAGSDTGNGASSEALIFVADASAEAERLTASLRTRGYVTVDVPLGLLLGRVAVQRPAIVLCDADAPDALDVVERMRDIPGGRSIDVLFLGEPGKILDAQAERLARQGSGIFVRPVDVYALLRKVESLIGPPTQRGARTSTVPQGSRVPVLVAATRRPYRYDTRARARNFPASPSPHPPGTMLNRGALGMERPAHGLSPTLDMEAHLEGNLSPDLAALLGRAEQRVLGARGTAGHGERLSPEAELEAVLPEDLLAALDEPLDELDGDDDDDVGTPGTLGSDSNIGSKTGSRPGHDSAAGTAPGGSVNPFAPRDSTTSGGERADGEDEPQSALADPAAEDLPPKTPQEGRSRSALPMATLSGTDATGFGSPEPGPASTHTAAVSTPPAEKEEPEDIPAPATIPPKQQVSTTPPRRRPGSSNPPAPAPTRTSGSDVEIPNTLRAGDSVRVLSRAVRSRYSGAFAFEDDAGIRRVVLRDGDFVTAAAGIDKESLVAFLVQRGDIAGDLGARLGRKLPGFGRYAGAALIAQGHLRQEDLWPVLRAHAEWLITRIATMAKGVASLERVVPPRLASEPSVFGGATGAEVLMEVVRRAIPPSDALSWLGGPDAELSSAGGEALLAECALLDAELELVRLSPSSTVGEIVERSGSPEFANVLFTLVELDVLKTRAAARRGKDRRAGRAAPDAIDHEALRARIQARRALVDEGDYFALLGVTKNATSYDIRRAYTTLRQEFDVGRILTPLTADLTDDVALIAEMLDEAYEILRDQVRRDRYRRALEQSPE